jgi:hypothetical protein
MIDWKIWFSTGTEHILDINGYDHMLFVVLLSMAYPVNEWKKLLGLITAFTIGHSLTLALSVANIIHFDQLYTEFFIVFTIFITAGFELFFGKNTANRGKVIYLIICCFGLIHGMGFSYLLRSMLGHEENILIPLLMFNIGLEVGQVICVVLVFVILWLISKYLINIEKHIRTSIIGLIFAVSILLCYSRLLNIFHE